MNHTDWLLITSRIMTHVYNKYILITNLELWRIDLVDDNQPLVSASLVINILDFGRPFNEY